MRPMTEKVPRHAVSTIVKGLFSDFPHFLTWPVFCHEVNNKLLTNGVTFHPRRALAERAKRIVKRLPNP